MKSLKCISTRGERIEDLEQGARRNIARKPEVRRSQSAENSGYPALPALLPRLLPIFGLKVLTRLTLHGTHTGILEVQPVVRLIPLTATFGIRDLVLRIVALNQVLHDASRLEQVDGLSVSELVSQCRDAAIGIDRKEPVFLLRVLADIDLLDFVGKTAIVSDDALQRHHSKAYPSSSKVMEILMPLGVCVV